MIEGVYCTSSKLWIGTGATRQKSISKRYWYAVEGENGKVDVQLLTSNLTPVGDKRPIDRDEFEEDYVFEPELQVMALKSVSVGASSGDDVLDLVEKTPQDALVDAVDQDLEAISLRREEQDVTESFDKGLTMIRGGYLKQGRKILLRLPEKDVEWKTKHKHMFNDFGRELRKEKEPEIALKHYLKAHELSPEDDHLCYNIARVYYDLHKMADCKRWLHRALVANPKLEPAQKFLQAIKNR